MKTQKRLMMLLLCIGLIATSRAAHADLVISFSTDQGATFGSNFELQVDDDLTVGIFLRQTAPDDILTTEGLSSFGLDLVATTSEFGEVANPSVNSQFDFEETSMETPTGFQWEYASASDEGVRASSVFLGEFDFASRSVGQTDFTLTDLFPGTGPGDASWFTSEITELDERIFGTGAAGSYQFSINSTAVPEPSSLLLLGAIGAVATQVRRRQSAKHGSEARSVIL
ncbi:MAG: PEP-CTERM sorting domain-containing protein [Pirellulaceae bacterium]